MLGNARIRSILPAEDLARAIRFYVDTLGLRAVRAEEEPSKGVVIEAGDGTTFYLYERAGTTASHTVAGFVVGDVDAVVEGLKGRGVRFEEYDTPELRTVNSVATFSTSTGQAKAAWFKDTEGNILDITDLPI